MDTGAYYSPYDAIPTPFNAGNGYEVPNVATLILNYKHDRFAITPTIRWDDGSNYGSPLVWPGYVPQSCTAQPSATPTTPGVSCPDPRPKARSSCRTRTPAGSIRSVRCAIRRSSRSICRPATT